jgi:hypothetical protein
MKMNKKGDWKTMAIVILTLIGILLLFIVIYRVIFKGGILKV